jgi:pyruvate formate lyase activating enzyme
MPEPLPLIFDIHRFALDDGPGIRTTVFLKGCPLRCQWCHNPEALSGEQELALYPQHCIRCGTCAVVCPQSAITLEPEVHIDRRRCIVCGNCQEECPALALSVLGRAYLQTDLLELLLRDRHFYGASGGGVTFSGGEPTLAMPYLSAVLQALRAAGVHTAIQTCGLFDYEAFAGQILPHIDLIMFDLKCIETAAHQRYTGRDNTLILDNFRRLARDAGNRLLPRVPLIPGMTATADNLAAIGSFLADQGCREVQLVSYNPTARDKWRAIGRRCPPALPTGPLLPAEEETLRTLILQGMRMVTAA